jgi:hypothetical protein
MLENLTRETFEPHLNTKFMLQRPDADPLELELVEITGGVDRGAAHSYSFSLIFRGAPTFYLQQHIYTLAHEQLGTLDIFLVPVARESDGFRYEAIFNRPAK